MNCKKCNDWICQAQYSNHNGMCVEHAEIDMSYVRKRK